VDDQLITQLAEQAELDGIVQLVVGAVVANEDRILLLKRPADDFMGGIFELPSGKVEPDESLDAALRRETKEETGLDLDEITGYLGHFDYTSGSGKPSRQFNFSIRTTATEPVVLTEHDGFQWAELTENVPVTDAVKAVLSEYMVQANPDLPR
jgi:8-oxo-dGTP diphosphatase